MLNNINLLNFKANNKTNNINVENKNANVTFLNFRGINAPKLAPLQHDTISFTSIRNGYTQDLFKATHNDAICKELSTLAKPYEEELYDILTNALQDSICTQDGEEKPIRRITSRTKSPVSIKEKSVDIYGEIKNKGKKDDFDPCNIEHLKKKIGDVVGARIILTQPKNTEIKPIIDTLIEEVEAGRIKITSIKNCVPENISQNAKKYTRLDSVMSLATAQVQKGGDVLLRDGKNTSGYIGIHIGVEFVDENKKGEAPIRGEIQIIDEYIAQLKDVEDFCYKIRGGKSIRGGDQAYIPFSDYFSQYYKGDDIKEDWLEYTRRAYEKQRETSISTTEEPTELTSLPTISQCGMTGKIPPQLDFNRLASIKQACDVTYKRNHEIK